MMEALELRPHLWMIKNEKIFQDKSDLHTLKIGLEKQGSPPIHLLKNQECFNLVRLIMIIVWHNSSPACWYWKFQGVCWSGGTPKEDLVCNKNSSLNKHLCLPLDYNKFDLPFPNNINIIDIGIDIVDVLRINDKVLKSRI